MARFIALILAIAWMLQTAITAQTAVAGTWRVEGDGPPFPWELVLRTDGTNLTGIVKTCASNGPREIFDVTLDRTSIKFKCRSGDGRRTISFAGEFNGDEIGFTWSLQFQEGSARDPRPDGLFGSSAPPRFTVRRAQDGELSKVANDVLGSVRGKEFAGAVNLLPADVKADGTLFVPQNVSRPKAILVVINWGLGFDVSTSTAWRKLSQTVEAALLGVRFSRISSSEELGDADQEARRDALLSLLNRLADDSGHAELKGAPMLFWGHSAAAQTAMKFAYQFPDRTLAFVRYHVGALPGEDVTAVSKIPGLILTGGKEFNPYNVPTSEGLWKKGRVIAAPWTFAVEPNATHADPTDVRKANDLMIPWITAVIRERLPLGGGTLRAVTDNTGWLGNNQTGDIAPVVTFTGPKAESSWLPDAASAKAWQIVIRGG